MLALDKDTIQKLATQDRSEAWDHLTALRSDVAKSLSAARKTVEDHARANGIARFVPNGYSASQAFAVRYEKIGTLDAILCDYDGCETVKSLCSLAAEAKDTFIDVIMCKPESVLAGSGCFRKSDVTISDYQKEHMVPAYVADGILGCNWTMLAVSYDEYAVKEDDPYGFAHRASLDMFYADQAQKRARQYIDSAEGKPFDPDQTLYEANATDHIKGSSKQSNLSEEQIEALDVHLLDCASSALSECDKALSSLPSSTDQAKRRIDAIRKAYADVFRATRSFI